MCSIYSEGPFICTCNKWLCNLMTTDAFKNLFPLSYLSTVLPSIVEASITRVFLSK